MQATSLPDWNKIGRKIGKRLRDILNPPVDTGPSKQKRLQERLADVHRGFAYFDHFDEILAWSADDINSIQRANIPLIQRSSTISHTNTSRSSRILLCHDYNGGYHNYEAVRSDLLDHEDYFCDYLQNVDVLVYFSHKLVCCPPPTWVNSLHRNGVKVLGTFCVEPGTHELEQMLHHEADTYTVAARLADMAEELGFDGWLLNIEKPFPFLMSDPITRLQAFLKDLRRRLGSAKQLVWYDGLTIENDVDYQNTLSPNNVTFAKAAGAIFTNYKWDKAKLSEASLTAENHGFETEDVYFGIDMWAQNTDMPGPQRITYPKKGGGGTLTGLAVDELARHKFSSAIFAPAWPSEHFPPLEAKAVDNSVWMGTSLPSELHCNCRNGRPHHQPDYERSPIMRSAREAVAGSEHFFQSDFQRAFQDSAGGVRSKIGLMWPQPRHNCVMRSSSWVDVAEMVQHWQLQSHYTFGPRPLQNDDLAFSDGSFLQVTVEKNDDQLVTKSASKEKHNEVLRLELYRLDMPADGSLVLTALCRKTNSLLTRSGLYLAYRSSAGEVHYQYIWVSNHTATSRSRVAVGCSEDESLMEMDRLIGFGVVYDDNGKPHASEDPILDLFFVSIAPDLEGRELGEITNICIVERASGDKRQTRLAWDWSYPREDWPSGRPWSRVTGPFERFGVQINGQRLAECGSVEYPLEAEDFDGNETTTLLVRGHLFGGGWVEAELTVHSPFERGEEGERLESQSAVHEVV